MRNRANILGLLEEEKDTTIHSQFAVREYSMDQSSRQREGEFIRSVKSSFLLQWSIILFRVLRGAIRRLHVDRCIMVAEHLVLFIHTCIYVIFNPVNCP